MHKDMRYVVGYPGKNNVIFAKIFGNNLFAMSLNTAKRLKVSINSSDSLNKVRIYKLLQCDTEKFVTHTPDKGGTLSNVSAKRVSGLQARSCNGTGKPAAVKKRINTCC